MAKYNKQYSSEQISNAAKTAICYSDIFRNLGIAVNGGSYTWLKNLINKFNIDISHFPPRNVRLIDAGNNHTYKRVKELYSTDDVSNGNRRSSKKLRAFMIFNRVEDKCAKCGIDSWDHLPLRLDIDHIDSNATNNKLDNLQFICPNCHRQKTITVPVAKLKTIQTKDGVIEQLVFDTAKPYIPKHNECSDCFKTISPDAIKCKSCARKGTFKIEWPEKEIMHKMLWEMPLTKLGKTLGCSDNAIIKHCKRNKLSRPEAGFWLKTKKEEIDQSPLSS